MSLLPFSDASPPTTNASLLTSGTLANARLSSTVSLDNIDNSFTAGQTITALANTSALTASYSVTGANTTPLVSLTGTWNTTGVAQGILLNVTDTASAATSALIDLRRAGSSIFNVSKFGGVSCFSINTNNSQINCGSVYMGLTSSVGWANADCQLYRDAANTLALRNGTNAQTFRLYNTFTDASNYERGFMRWNSNVLEIGAEAGGTGTQRQLSFPLGAVTASTPLYITQAWNNAATSFSGILVNITQTLAASTSQLINLQRDSITRFQVSATGNCYTSAVFTSPNGYRISSNLDGTSQTCSFQSTGVSIPSGATYGFTSVTSGLASNDTILARDAANTLALRNGGNYQTYNIYGTFSSLSLFERLRIAATNDRNQIISESTGATVRPLEISFFSSAFDPTTLTINSGTFGVWKNTTSGVLKIWANDNGTLKSIALV